MDRRAEERRGADGLARPVLDVRLECKRRDHPFNAGGTHRPPGVLRLVVAAGVPLLAVIAKQVSLNEFLKWIVTVIL